MTIHNEVVRLNVAAEVDQTLIGIHHWVEELLLHHPEVKEVNQVVLKIAMNHHHQVDLEVAHEVAHNRIQKFMAVDLIMKEDQEDLLSQATSREAHHSQVTICHNREDQDTTLEVEVNQEAAAVDHELAVVAQMFANMNLNSNGTRAR